jgi:hypothetical protein
MTYPMIMKKRITNQHFTLPIVNFWNERIKEKKKKIAKLLGK